MEPTKENKETIDFIYKYAWQSIKNLDSSYDALMMKSGLVLALDLLVILISSEIKTFNIPVVTSLMSVMISIVFCFFAIRPSKRGSMVVQSEYIEELMTFSKTELQKSLSKQMTEQIDKYIIIRDSRSILVRGAIVFMCLSGLLSSLGVILSVIQ